LAGLPKVQQKSINLKDFVSPRSQLRYRQSSTIRESSTIGDRGVEQLSIYACLAGSQKVQKKLIKFEIHFRRKRPSEITNRQRLALAIEWPKKPYRPGQQKVQ
jgi:hypothetical protein